MLKRKLFSSLTPATRTAWGAAIATACPELLQLLNHLFSALDRNERTACVGGPAQPWHRNAIQQPPSRSPVLGQRRVLEKGSIRAQKKLRFTLAPVSGGRDSDVAAGQSHMGDKEITYHLPVCCSTVPSENNTSQPHPATPAIPHVQRDSTCSQIPNACPNFFFSRTSRAAVLIV